MIDDHYLPYFITEEVYLVSEKSTSAATQSTAEQPETTTATTNEPPAPTVEEPTPVTQEPEIAKLAIWAPPFTTADRDMFTKMLTAINEDFNKAKLMEGINAYDPHYEKLLCFGFQKELELKIGESIPLYSEKPLAGKRILVAVSPAELHADKKQKTLLWEALKKMFGVSK